MEKGVHLSIDVVRELLGYFDAADRARMSLVSGTWREVADEAWLWTQEEAQVRIPEHNGPALECIRRRKIKKVKVLSIGGYLPRQLRWLLEALPHIRGLDLSPCTEALFDYAIEKSIGTQQLSSLTSINLKGCYRISDNSVRCISEHCVNIEELYLAFCKFISDSSMRYAVEKMVKLKILDITQSRVTDSGLRVLAGITDIFPRDAVGGRALESLTLSSCNNVTDTGLGFIAATLTHLVTVDLSNCRGITDNAVERCSHIPTLKNLFIALCENITNLSIRHLTRGTAALSKLNVRGCTLINDDAFCCKDTGPGLTDLTTLTLSSMPITDLGLARMAGLLRHVTILDVSECKNITNRGVAVVSCLLPKLTRLDINRCTKLTNAVMRNLSSVPCLQALSLEGVGKLTTKGWLLAARSIRKSEIIELNVAFTGAEDRAVRLIAEFAPRLRSLDLSGCAVFNRSLSIVDRHCIRLHTLKVKSCVYITDTGVDYLGTHNKNLKILHLAGCPFVSEEAIKNLQLRIPYLAIE